MEEVSARDVEPLPLAAAEEAPPAEAEQEAAAAADEGPEVRVYTLPQMWQLALSAARYRCHHR